MRTTNPQTLWGIEMEIPGFVEEWEKSRKGGHEDETDLERAAACKLPLWANVWGTGRRIHRDLYDALLCTNVYADGALNKSKRK